MSDERRARESVVESARALHRLGLSAATTGNVSCRWAGGMLITPTALPYDTLQPGEIVHVLHDGSVPAGRRSPSSEWRLHLAAYTARSDRHAVVHCHSTHAVILACAHRPIPAFHYMVAAAGGNDVPCTPYATYGTEVLARHAAAALARRDACLMANHGQVALGPTLEAALDLAWIVEDLSRQYLGVRQLGEPYLLDDAEMEQVAAKMRERGRER
jgi:L-fuculose-phosphate aldolase